MKFYRGGATNDKKAKTNHFLGGVMSEKVFHEHFFAVKTIGGKTNEKIN